MSRPGIGVQLYTLRSLPDGLLATLEAVAALGYEGVELAGLHGVPPSDVRSRCDALGLTVAGAHVGIERVESDPAGVAAELEALGVSRLVLPATPRADAPGGAAVVAERLALVVELARSRGLVPLLHNHWWEFEGPPGGRLWDAVTSVDGLELELDLGWLWVAGEDPAAHLDAAVGRAPLVHVKDFVRDDTGTRDVPVGEGEIDFGPLLARAAETGVEWFLVEQDEPGADPLDACARSLAGVRALLDDYRGLM
jgi:sugar phosphate isomerase/epimerase